MYAKTVTLTMLWESTFQVLSVNELVLVLFVATAQNLPLWPYIGPPPPLLLPAAVEGNTRGHTYVQQAAAFDFPLNSSNSVVP